MRETVLVTGGAGFIGSNYVHHLLETFEECSVVTLDALTYAGDMKNLESVSDHPRHEFVEGNIGDESLVRELVERADVVVNFAAESHVDRSIEGAKSFVDTNVQGTRTLLEAALDTDIERFVQISTDEVYGEIEDGAFTEDDTLDPRNPYAATKAAGDLLANSYYETYGLPVTITRSSNNFGPRQHSEKLIPKFIAKASEGEPLPLYGDGSNVREWTYVTDNCRGVTAAIREGEPGEIYNIGSRDERTNLEVTRAIIDVVGASEELIEFVEDRPGHDKRYALDSGQIRELGWEPEWTFEEGLRRTVEYYVE